VRASEAAAGNRAKTPPALVAQWNGNAFGDSARASRHHASKASNHEITLPQEVRGMRDVSQQRTDSLSWLVESLHGSRNTRPTRHWIEAA
jgi:hypothetical protein